MLGILVLRSKAGEFPLMRPVWDVEKDCLKQGEGCDGLRTERSCNNGARGCSDKL